jgi:hypothetical protein
MDDGEYCILREETVRERRGSYNGFCCRLYPFICWIIIKEGPGNFSGGHSPHWVNHVNLCLSCIVCLLCFVSAFVLFYFIAPRSCFSNNNYYAWPANNLHQLRTMSFMPIPYPCFTSASSGNPSCTLLLCVL